MDAMGWPTPTFLCLLEFTSSKSGAPSHHLLGRVRARKSPGLRTKPSTIGSLICDAVRLAGV